MVKVSGVALQSVKKIVFSKGQVNFGMQQSNAELPEQNKRNGSNLAWGLAGLGVIILATLAIRKGYLKKVSTKEMPNLNASQTTEDNASLQKGILKIKGGKAYKDGELFTGFHTAVKNGKNFDMKFNNGILQELITFKPSENLEPSIYTVRKYKWFKNGKTAEIDITKTCGDVTTKERVTRSASGSDVVEYRSEFKYGPSANNNMILNKIGLVNVNESCHLKRVFTSGKVEHLTEYKGINYDNSIIFVCDKNGAVVGAPIFQKVAH